MGITLWATTIVKVNFAYSKKKAYGVSFVLGGRGAGVKRACAIRVLQKKRNFLTVLENQWNNPFWYVLNGRQMRKQRKKSLNTVSVGRTFFVFFRISCANFFLLSKSRINKPVVITVDFPCKNEKNFQTVCKHLDDDRLRNKSEHSKICKHHRRQIQQVWAISWPSVIRSPPVRGFERLIQWMKIHTQRAIRKSKVVGGVVWLVREARRRVYGAWPHPPRGPLESVISLFSSLLLHVAWLLLASSQFGLVVVVPYSFERYVLNDDEREYNYFSDWLTRDDSLTLD